VADKLQSNERGKPLALWAAKRKQAVGEERDDWIIAAAQDRHDAA
jgi:hypothetical protein